MNMGLTDGRRLAPEVSAALAARDQRVAVRLDELEAAFIEACDEFHKHAITWVWNQGVRLLGIKKVLPHGQFESWCDAHLPVKQPQRTKWMKLAKDYPNNDLPADMTIDVALGYTKPKVPAKSIGVRQLGNGGEPSTAEQQQMEMDALRERAERAEADEQVAVNRVEQLEELAAKVLADEPEDALKTKIWNEGIGAQAAQSVAESEAHKLSHLLEDQKRETQKLKRRLGAIKNALLRGASPADILAKHFNAAKA